MGRFWRWFSLLALFYGIAFLTLGFLGLAHGDRDRISIVSLVLGFAWLGLAAFVYLYRYRRP